MANHASISGAWVLDLSRSDSFEGYLRHLGTPERVVQAQVAGERAHQSPNAIALDDSRLVIYRGTALNNNTQTFELNEDRVTPMPRGGSNTCTVSLGNEGRLDGYVVADVTTAPGGEIILETMEARQLVEGGLAHIQIFQARRTAVGGQSTTRRTWVRVPMTQLDHMRLLS